MTPAPTQKNKSWRKQEASEMEDDTKNKSENGIQRSKEEEESDTFLNKLKYSPLLSSFPVILVLIGNLPEIMGLYSPYVYLPVVSYAQITGF